MLRPVRQSGVAFVSRRPSGSGRQVPRFPPQSDTGACLWGKDAPEFSRTGDLPEAGAHGDTEPQRLPFFAKASTDRHGVPDMNAIAAPTAFSKSAMPCRMDAAKRSQSHLDCVARATRVPPGCPAGRLSRCARLYYGQNKSFVALAKKEARV